jgi:hypothetical protein
MNTETLNDINAALNLLGYTDDELEVVIGGSQTYEIDGAGTKWAPLKGTRKFNPDAFIVIRKPSQVISSKSTSQ